MEPQIEGTEVKIWTSALTGGLCQSLPKFYYYHEFNVSCVDLLHKDSSRAQRLACGMERFPDVKCENIPESNVFYSSVYKFIDNETSTHYI